MRAFVAGAALLSSSGCCVPFYGIWVPGHTWSVLVRPPAKALEDAVDDADGNLSASMCKELCPAPRVSPGGPIVVRVRSCRRARRIESSSEAEVVVCEGETDGSCAKGNFSHATPSRLVAGRGCAD